MLHKPAFHPRAVSVEELGVVVIVGIGGMKIDATNLPVVLAIRTEAAEVAPTINHPTPRRVLTKIRGRGRRTAKA